VTVQRAYWRKCRRIQDCLPSTRDGSVDIPLSHAVFGRIFRPLL
jgi:hypothetical protein